MFKSLTTEEFINKADLVHKKKYDYSRVKYIDAHTHVTIICPIHGEFLQAPTKHLAGSGCSDCAKKPKINTEIIINQFKAAPLNKKYDENIEDRLIEFGIIKKESD